jgi:hypothetical protein
MMEFSMMSSADFFNLSPKFEISTITGPGYYSPCESSSASGAAAAAAEAPPRTTTANRRNSRRTNRATSCADNDMAETTTTGNGKETGIEIYSVDIVPSNFRPCEFLAPHSVEAWIDVNEKPVNVLYFQPSRCVCFHCLLSERLELPVNVGRHCFE